MKKLMIFVCVALLSACSSDKKDDTQVAPPGAPTAEKPGIGPYTISFGADNSYTHNFNYGITQQTGGKIDYFVRMPKASDIEFVSTTLKVTGCNASAVQHQVQWIPNSADQTRGSIIAPTMTFKTMANTEGIIRHVVTGLSGCKSVNLTTNLKLKVAAKMPCRGNTSSACEVKVYCKEQDPLSNYVEVEIWNESWGLNLYKFMNSPGRDRGAMLTTTVTPSEDSTSLRYSSNSGTLVINKTSWTGVLTEKIAGQTFTTDLNCQIQ